MQSVTFVHTGKGWDLFVASTCNLHARQAQNDHALLQEQDHKHFARESL